MILTDVEHCRPQVELVEELGDEDVHLQHVGDILSLDVPEHIDEPLKVTVGGADPEEVDLLASHPRVPVGGGAKHQVVEDAGIGGDADASANHDGNLKLVPVLVATTKRPLYPNLWGVVLVLLLVVDLLVEGVPQFPCPGPHGLDMHLQEVFMRR